MSTPQQPELARTGLGATDPSSAKRKARTAPPPDRGESGPVPEDNLPGHHPSVEQDKPTAPPTLPPRHRRFRFRRDRPFLWASVPFGVLSDDHAYVDVNDEQLEIRFGPWRLVTPLDNVESAERTGPYQWWKVIGPPHLSMKDSGITFATTNAEGVCIRFRTPVPAALPSNALLHAGATVTVEDADDLVQFLS
jgi:hypothetical protein